MTFLTQIKTSVYPSAGGIGMFFVKVYGKGTITASAALLMAASMVLSQSIIARTFGTYTLQLFNIGPQSWLVPVLGVGLLIFAFMVNISKNYIIETFTSTISLIKIVGLAIFFFRCINISRFLIRSLSSIFFFRYSSNYTCPARIRSCCFICSGTSKF